MTGIVSTPLWSEWLALHDRLTADVVRTGRSSNGGLTDGQPILVAGVAGALGNELRPGDLVVADEIRGDAEPLPSHASPLLVGALRRAGLRVHRGPIVTTRRIVDAPDARRTLAATGALAVDTESALVAAAAPPGLAAVIRAVVDTPDHRLLRPGTLVRGPKALWALRRAAPVIDAWAAASGDREVVLAGPRSFCAGVERAIEIVERALVKYGPPVYVRRQIVHNSHVVRELERRGAVFVDEVAEVPEGSVTVLAAHGVAPQVRTDAAARNLRMIDATCPLVAKVHSEVRRFVARGNTVFLIGHRDHEEVVGTQGEAPGQVVVVADPDEAGRVRVADPRRVSYVMQTTLAVEEAEQTAAVLRDRFPALNGPRSDDICYATTNRQQAVRAVARDADLVLVLGSANSSNSQRLAEVAAAEGAQAYLVDDASTVDLRWLRGVRRIGVTAGASAPPQLVDDLVRCLSGLGRVAVTETRVADEDIRFTLPREVS
ncbi:4-hydroxy-3-methylbut-2-enyl diphosphate reductase [Kribbella orskensis]|uniref:4-hydroxy-3-methylbut-2-enyl diphosphate reductase n=1 Tax=Kribbella orskensis TaxID=2512216 RepID=A0ABY2BMZ1_9ACTN|nr:MULTISPECIES: 4-hydroxy-3-methylbut-2-enyl diphosphate reductase [Kribbella]TCN41714.1 4-hydroxy-3-methylbut-2-enyl diphosphate reductase [Kribbella sp. VKM Ac-2500]TCO25592.1 4-hydroxy-3-methylbut-2-enyl diphosphate reductase [Kribbella orskensis]